MPPAQSQGPREPAPIKKREKTTLNVYNSDGSLWTYDPKEKNPNPTNDKENNKPTHSQSNVNKEAENKPPESETNRVQEQAKPSPTINTTTAATEINSVENAIDVGVPAAASSAAAAAVVAADVDAPLPPPPSSPPSDEASARNDSVTLGKVDTKCDTTEAADTDKDVGDIADKLNSTHLNQENEETVVDSAAVVAGVTKANVELETGKYEFIFVTSFFSLSPSLSSSLSFFGFSFLFFSFFFRMFFISL